MRRRFAPAKRQTAVYESSLKERQMNWVTASGMRRALARTAAAAAIAGVAVMSATVPANAMPSGVGLRDIPVPLRPPAVQDDPTCARGLFESPPDDGIPRDNTAEGGIPGPAMGPNVDGTLSPPGTPGAV